MIRNDELNNCSCLILDNPMTPRASAFVELKKYNIDYAKYALSHTDINGKNMLTYIWKIHDAVLDKVYSSLLFYNEQVLRQLKENGNSNSDNIFELNQNEKRDIVLSEYKDIVEYLTDTAENCVWGDLHQNRKLQMQDSISRLTIDSKRRKNNLVDIITNYTTLSELEQGIVKTKTLDRFIIK